MYKGKISLSILASHLLLFMALTSDGVGIERAGHYFNGLISLKE
jgi:hypothetical protein